MRDHNDGYMKGIDILAAGILAIGGLCWVRSASSNSTRSRPPSPHEPDQPIDLCFVRAGGGLRNLLLSLDPAAMGVQTVARNRGDPRGLMLEWVIRL